MSRAVARMLGERRLHLQDGPIDLIVTADGAPAAVAAAYRAAASRFQTILDELCAELPLLRSHADPSRQPAGVVAERMWRAVLPFASETFITPMAAVAGAVADEVMDALTAVAALSRASVNNGGDIAVRLAEGQSWRIGLVDRPDRPSLFGTTVLRHGDGIGGIATSGWRGRSFSLGIADAVTVLAASAAEADAAATVVANAVDLPGHPAIRRVPATNIQPDSDLGDRLVTREVGELTPDEINVALTGGVARAEEIVRRGRIAGAALHLAGITRVAERRRTRDITGRSPRRTLGSRGHTDKIFPSALAPGFRGGDGAAIQRPPHG